MPTALTPTAPRRLPATSRSEAARPDGAAGSIGALSAACLAVLLLAGPAPAQVCGDVNADDVISVSDAQRVLRAAVGQPVELICEGQCSALEERLALLEALLANVTVDGDNLVLTGMNFQVVSGSGETDGDTNGTGNIIIGYNETNEQSDDGSGSHNLVIGQFHSYSGYGGIIAGEDNEILGANSSVLGGEQNRAEEDGSVIVAGQDNETDGEFSVILGGEFNHTLGRSCSVIAGTLNLCTGFSSSIGGGSNNLVSGDRSVIGGTSNRSFGSALGWLSGSLTQF
jgi:hypothetical protein